MKLNDECEHHALIAEKAVCAFYEGKPDMESSVVDLLTDLRHLCDQLGFDFHRLEDRSFAHYSAERVGPTHPGY